MDVGLGDEVVHVLDVLGEVTRVLVKIHPGHGGLLVHDVQDAVFALEVPLLGKSRPLSQPREVDLRLHALPEHLDRAHELAHPRLRLVRLSEHLLSLHELRDDGVKGDDRELVGVEHQQKRAVVASVHAPHL